MKHKLFSFGMLVAMSLTASQALAGGDICQVTGIKMGLDALLDEGKVKAANEYAKEQAEVLLEKITNGKFTKLQKAILTEMRNQLLIVAKTDSLKKQKLASYAYGRFIAKFAKALFDADEPEEQVPPKVSIKQVGPAKAATTH